jgi:hypothetical protein
MVGALTARRNRILRVRIMVDVGVAAVGAEAEDVRGGVGEIDSSVGFDDAATSRTDEVALRGWRKVSAAAG